MLSLISKFVNPYVVGIQIIAILVSLGGLGFLYWKWEQSVRAAAVLEWKVKLTEQMLVDEENHAKLLQSQIDIANKLVEDHNKKLEQLQTELDNAEKIVQDKHADEDAAPVLKDTIDVIMKARKP
jgi:hypothetical protein